MDSLLDKQRLVVGKTKSPLSRTEASCSLLLWTERLGDSLPYWAAVLLSYTAGRRHARYSTDTVWIVVACRDDYNGKSWIRVPAPVGGKHRQWDGHAPLADTAWL